MKKKKAVYALISASIAFALQGCGEENPGLLENDVKEKSTVESDSTEDITNGTEGIIKLEEGENEYTEAVYEFASSVDEIQG